VQNFRFYLIDGASARVRVEVRVSRIEQGVVLDDRLICHQIAIGYRPLYVGDRCTQRIALRQNTDAVVIVADRFRRENVNQCSNDNMVARTISRVLRGRRKTDEPPV